MHNVFKWIRIYLEETMPNIHRKQQKAENKENKRTWTKDARRRYN